MPARCGADGSPAHRGSIAKGACEKQGAASSKGRIDPQTATIEGGIRPSAVERSPDDHQLAFAAEPQFDQSRSGLTIERGGRSGLDDCAHPPSPSFLRGRENNRVQEIPSFGREFSAMSSSDTCTGKVSVEGSQINLRAVTAIPLGFIANELITNAAKYGKGRIAIRLEPEPRHGYALSVSNDGPALPEGFDPCASKRLGMKIVRSFTDQIGGELQIERGADGQGARFTVLFSAPVV
jgi:hypothetical protein